MKILVLGAGMQGRAALHDLARSPDVSHVIAADVDTRGAADFVATLGADKIAFETVDATEHDRVAALMRECHAVIDLLPTRFRSDMTQLAVANGVHLVNASYATPQDEALAAEAAARGCAVLPEFGLDPGIDIVMAAAALAAFDEVSAFLSYGAGIPERSAANNPLQYKISWSFAGVLDSYQRPARLLRDGQPLELARDQVFDADNTHSVEVEALGTLEAIPNGDVTPFLKRFGLGDTVREAGRFSLRWPGHAAFWSKMVALGFLDDTPLAIGDAHVSPRQFVHDLLAPQLQYGAGERDIALARVEVEGRKNDSRKRLIYQVIDRRDLETGLLGMQRTVGYTASIGAQMILRGDIAERGLLSPATDVPTAVFFDELRKRGIAVERTELPAD
ncbi:MAG: saccharopine dehydrogenase family protein [Anaerolineales bacterium]